MLRYSKQKNFQSRYRHNNLGKEVTWQRKKYTLSKKELKREFFTHGRNARLPDGYSGAQYKSFLTKEEAQAYLSGVSNPLQNSVKETTKINEGSENSEASKNMVVAYVDGSFHKELGRYSFGCVLLMPDGEIIRESGNGDNPESLALRNVTGEMLGAMYAVKWCEVNGYTAVKICYDYMGIEMWATGGWKTNNKLTQKYAEFMRGCASRIQITFQKIAAHTGDKYNEEADKLAKAALTEKTGIPKVQKRR